MSATVGSTQSPVASLTEAQWYDLSIDWNARMKREIPVLTEVFGPPGGGGVLDAGCGSGHQVAALSQKGYRVVGADLNEEMLAVARSVASSAGVSPTFVQTAYTDLAARLGSGFDAVYCLANSLAASGSRASVREAVEQFSKCLRLGGRLFVQVLNFPTMRKEVPCVKGPRVTKVGGVEYISARNFAFDDDGAMVSNITCWNDGGWKCHAQGRRLYPVTLDELRSFCGEANLRIDAVWGNYAKEPFDPDRSVDVIVVGTRG